MRIAAAQGIVRSRHYESVNLGPREYEAVIFADLRDASGILGGMTVLPGSINRAPSRHGQNSEITATDRVRAVSLTY